MFRVTVEFKLAKLYLYLCGGYDYEAICLQRRLKREIGLK